MSDASGGPAAADVAELLEAVTSRFGAVQTSLPLVDPTSMRCVVVKYNCCHPCGVYVDVLIHIPLID